MLGGVVESEDGGPKGEKMVQVHHKVEIRSVREERRVGKCL